MCSPVDTAFKAVSAVTTPYLGGGLWGRVALLARELFVHDVRLLGGEVFVASPVP